MEMTSLLPVLAQAFGGLLAANVLAGLTRGGGGALGRSFAGIVGGAAAGQLAPLLVDARPLIDSLFALAQGDAGLYLGNLLLGAGGGGFLGLVAGLLFRPRS